MSLLGAAYHTIRRRAPGAWVEGVFEPGAEVETTVWGSVQPIIGRVVEIRQEGARLEGSFFLFTKDDTLQLTDLGLDTDSDILLFRGREYKIYKDQDWMGHTTGLPHHQHVLVEVGLDELAQKNTATAVPNYLVDENGEFMVDEYGERLIEL